MGVRRTELAFEGQFTQIPNAWVRDERLSRKARGVLTEIMSHRIGWHVSVNGLVKSGPEGRDAIKAALVELKDAGYLQVSQTRGDGGRWNEVEYELCDPSTADGFSVTGGSAANGSAASGQSAPKNTIYQEDHPEELLSAVADDGPNRLDEIWNLWPSPRRSTRKVAEQKLRAALKVASWDQIISAAVKHSEIWATWSDSDRRQFIPLLPTWLHQERWTGSLPEMRSGRLSALDTGRAADALLSAVEAPHLRALS